MISGKVWGSTELIEANGALEFHRIATRKGGVCTFMNLNGMVSM
jgi:hypothetical protein